MLRHGLEQLACLAGRADNQPLTVGHQLRFGDDGHAPEILQVGRRHQLVQVLEAQLVLRQNNDMLGEAVGLTALGPQLEHLAVDLLQAVDPQFLLHLFKKRNEHIGHHGRVVRGPVVVERRQVQMLRHDVQLIFLQLRQQILRQDQRIHISRVKLQAHLAAAGADKANIELGIVRRQRTTVHKAQEVRQRLLELRRVSKHGVGDTG